MSATIAATVVASGSIFFSGFSINTGNVTAAGCTYFNDDSEDNGAVNGCVEYAGAPAEYIVSDPPLVATWQTSGSTRRVVIQGTRNADQLRAIGISVKTFYGPWQNCPTAGCFTNPALYRPLAPCDYVLDFAGHPNYEVE